jgi:hypothetical protein
MSMTPFEIRLELLKMAKEMLVEDYYTKKEQITNNWSTTVDSAKQTGSVPPEHPAMPEYPTEAQIIEKASTLNGFVSQTTPQPEIKITKKSNS